MPAAALLFLLRKIYLHFGPGGRLLVRRRDGEMNKSKILRGISIAVLGLSLNLAGTMAFGKPFSKVMIVVLENANYEVALGQPFQATLAKNGALLANYHGVWHPSQPNYVAMTSGTFLHTYTDRDVTLNSPNIVDLLEANHKTWKVYAEQYPGNCFTGSQSGKYARKHNPFISYVNIQSNPRRCARIVNASELAVDVRNHNIPDYSFYIPDEDNDGHDTNAAYADHWLQGTFGNFLADRDLRGDLLFVVTYDESETYTNNHILTVFYGEGVKSGVVSNQYYNHYSLLRTVEAAWNLGQLKSGDEKAAPITDIWK